MLKGALHVHSNYSDGEFTLAELRDIFRSENYAFVCMSDHAEYFNDELVKRYVAECESLSDTTFHLVPGLEFRCEQHMHILGYHATQLTESRNPEEVIRHIVAQGALSVIAHPKNDSFKWIEGFSTLPQGIETWNSKYDGQYAPRSATFRLLQRLRQRAPNMHAFYGIDLHWKKQFRDFSIALDSDSVENNAIIAALAAGKYTAQKANLSLPSSGILPESLFEQFDRVHGRSHQFREFLKRAKKALDRLGIRIPAAVKAQLRRIF